MARRMKYDVEAKEEAKEGESGFLSRWSARKNQIAKGEDVPDEGPSSEIAQDTVIEDEDDSGDDEIDIHLAEISLSPYNVQDYEDCGEDQVEKLPLQGPIADFVKEFVEIHFKPEPFIKRKRDKARLDRDQLGGADPRLRRDGDMFQVPSDRKKRGEYH